MRCEAPHFPATASCFLPRWRKTVRTCLCSVPSARISLVNSARLEQILWVSARQRAKSARRYSPCRACPASLCRTMPVGGKLVLKGGLQVTAHGVEKKKKKKKKAPALEDLTEEERKQLEEKKKAQTGISVQSGKTYEQEFDLEMAKAKEGKVKNTPWGSSFRAPPEILHGYDKKVKGKTAEERLDLRCAVKGDKFCK